MHFKNQWIFKQSLEANEVCHDDQSKDSTCINPKSFAGLIGFYTSKSFHAI